MRSFATMLAAVAVVALLAGGAAAQGPGMWWLSTSIPESGPAVTNPMGPWTYIQDPGDPAVQGDEVLMDQIVDPVALSDPEQGGTNGALPLLGEPFGGTAAGGVIDHEMPQVVRGWSNAAANWQSAARVLIDSVSRGGPLAGDPPSVHPGPNNPSIPDLDGKEGDDTTNFTPLTDGVPQWGGHAPSGAVWTAPEDGHYKVSWYGFVARNSRTANSPGELGRITPMTVWGPDGTPLGQGTLDVGGLSAPDVLDDQTIDPGDVLHEGYANRLEDSHGFIWLDAGDTITMHMGGGDWRGYDLHIMVPEPASACMLLIGSLALLGFRRRR